jgi:hypothetical protein
MVFGSGGGGRAALSTVAPAAQTLEQAMASAYRTNTALLAQRASQRDRRERAAGASGGVRR